VLNLEGTVLYLRAQNNNDEFRSSQKVHIFKTALKNHVKGTWQRGGFSGFFAEIGSA
jgi:hypothetical protein